jgi:hypothetical protein
MLTERPQEHAEKHYISAETPRFSATHMASATS